MEMRPFIVIAMLALILVWIMPASAQIPYPFMSVQEIQQVEAGDDSSYQAAFPADTIWTTGIVTVGAGEMYAGGNITLYMQDAAGGPWSGILLFNSDNSAFNVSRGDSVIVIGTIGEYTTVSDSLETGYNIETSMTELITTQAVLKVGEDKPRPEIITLTPADLDSLSAIERDAEQLEACQVKVENVVVTSQESAYRQFWVSDDGGWSQSCVIRLYADSLENYPIPPAGSVFESITGVVYHVYGNYTLLCRKPEDLVLATGAPLIGYSYAPMPPQPEDTVSVDITIVDDGSVVEAVLYYQLNGGEFYDVPLEHLGGASYLGQRPPQPQGTVVGFYVMASDNVGNISYEPENAPSEVTSYTVVQSVPSTIYDINYTTDAGTDSTYPSPLLGSLVTVSAVITADHSVSSTHFYLQDDTDPHGTGGAWSGVYVYDEGVYSPAIGDKIQLTAEVGEYYGKTELLNIASYTLLSSGNTPPDPAVIQTGDLQYDTKDAEPYEGVYVRLNNVTVTNPDADTYHNWHVSDGSGTAQIDAPATAVQYTYEPKLNDHIEFIIGCVEYTYDQFEIEVRSDDDFGPVTTGVEEISGQMPLEYSLSQNYPNPFNPVTRLTYTLPQAGAVKIEIFNVTGQKVRTLVDGTMSAGQHTLTWRSVDDHGNEVASGLYFCRFQAGDFKTVRKMVLLK
jgi:predicted extracellular nuclease